MPRKKTSVKPVKFSEERPFEDYSPGADVSLAGLKEAIVEALLENDIDTFKGCIALTLKRYGYREIAGQTGLSKSTLYRMCEPGSNPTLENVGKFMSFINEENQKKVA